MEYFGQPGGFITPKSKIHANKESSMAHIWSTSKVSKLVEDYQEGRADIAGYKNTPFFKKDIEFRAPNLSYEYTDEELDELKRCAMDIEHFTKNYVTIKDEDGKLLKIRQLRDYQEEILDSFVHNQMNILMAARQIGKSITSAIFIVHFMLFHRDKNVMIVADVSDTTKEILDKVRSIIEHLPFFMKPGIVINNVQSMKLDNGCRLIGRTTTKKTGIGFSIDLLYMDEFAHINEAYIEFFYRSIYPTISGIKTSKIIITSTPNGTNKFYKLWQAAVEGNNSYAPLRVDYWQVPGRDEAWKERTIADLGSIEDFNQEYGLQFYSSDELMLDSIDIKKINKMKVEYVSRKVNSLVIDYDGNFIDYSRYMSFHPNFLKNTLLPNMENLLHDDNFYLMSIDTGDGIGKDFSVANIFKLAPLPIDFLMRNRSTINDAVDIFSLVQVAKFRINVINTSTFADIMRQLVYEFFNIDRLVVVVELNHKGEIIKERIEKHARYFPGILIHTKHTVNSKYFEPGLILNSYQKKKEYCDSFTYKLSINKVLPNDKETVLELGSFGKVNNSSSYRSQSGNDDLAITAINASSFFDSPQYYEFSEIALDAIKDPEYITRLNEEIIEYNQKMLETDRPFDKNLMQTLTGGS